ncbi:MAG: hypothetical protein IJF92_05320 [Bacilli bacterium]|nr:hypothetical protein [Bacilli bacterium]
MYNYPYIRPSILSRGLELVRGIKWGSLLDGTQKTLGVINQAIPIVYQVKPIMNNAKTLFKIADSFKNVDLDNTNNKNTSIKNSYENKPIFYI